MLGSLLPLWRRKRRIKVQLKPEPETSHSSAKERGERGKWEEAEDRTSLLGTVIFVPTKPKDVGARLTLGTHGYLSPCWVIQRQWQPPRIKISVSCVPLQQPKASASPARRTQGGWDTSLAAATPPGSAKRTQLRTGIISKSHPHYSSTSQPSASPRYTFGLRRDHF